MQKQPKSQDSWLEEQIVRLSRHTSEDSRPARCSDLRSLKKGYADFSPFAQPTAASGALKIIRHAEEDDQADSCNAQAEVLSLHSRPKRK
ncbi:MAG: hypothetical protein OXT67_04320 [Zetaproteobacteria bacterium]|nr:hypothetical protein [Zetaproteobacteria bacterium]